MADDKPNLTYFQSIIYLNYNSYYFQHGPQHPQGPQNLPAGAKQPGGHGPT